jgi:hypothetical protein
MPARRAEPNHERSFTATIIPKTPAIQTLASGADPG